MEPQTYRQPVVDRNIVMRRMTVYGSHGSRGSSVGAGTTLLARRPQNRGSICSQARDISLLQSIQTVSEALPNSYSMVITGSYSEGKEAGA
jgi:hypothetical protein